MPQDWADILEAAAKAPSGVVALAFLIVASLGFAFFNRERDWRVRFAAFVLIITGLGLGIYSIQQAATPNSTVATSVEPSSSEPPSLELSSSEPSPSSELPSSDSSSSTEESPTPAPVATLNCQGVNASRGTTPDGKPNGSTSAWWCGSGGATLTIYQQRGAGNCSKYVGMYRDDTQNTLAKDAVADVLAGAYDKAIDRIMACQCHNPQFQIFDVEPERTKTLCWLNAKGLETAWSPTVPWY